MMVELVPTPTFVTSQLRKINKKLSIRKLHDHAYFTLPFPKNQKKRNNSI